MGCAPSKVGSVEIIDNIEENSNSTTIVKPIKYPPAEAFDIPLEDVENNSLIKKYPPKRLQRLVETTSVTPKLEDLEEKLAKAEIRRKQYLQQFVVRAVNSIPKLHESENNINLNMDSKNYDEDKS